MKHSAITLTAAILLLLAVPACAGTENAPETHLSTKKHVFSTQMPTAGMKTHRASTNRVLTATSRSSFSTPLPLSSHPGAQQQNGLSGQSARLSSTGHDYTTHSASMQEEMMMNFINQDRAARGLSPLLHDPELSRIARIKSEDMRDRGYFSHESPVYGRVRDMLTRFGYDFRGAGENIAHHATIEKAQAAFMSSDGHRRNILSHSWTRAGVGVCFDRHGYVYVTQIFAR